MLLSLAKRIPFTKGSFFKCRERILRVGLTSSTSSIRKFHQVNEESKVLICGDGDLSYAASIAKDLAEKDIQLTATVLESEEQHREVFRDSIKNSEIIESCGHKLRYETDATLLGTYNDMCMDGRLFDRIQFNFPHWEGKTNARNNRNLLSNFFAATRAVLQPTGRVHVALMDHQGGSMSSTLTDWRQSWMAGKLAAEQNLLLVDVSTYEPSYKLSAYKWKDLPFKTKGNPQQYIFANPDCPDARAPQHLQMYSYFQFFLEHPIDMDEGCFAGPPTCEIEYISNWVQDRTPTGWRSEVHFIRWMDGRTIRKPEEHFFALYEIVLFGEERPMTRGEADAYRLSIQEQMMADGIRRSQRGFRIVSGVGPYSILQNYFENPNV